MSLTTPLLSSRSQSIIHECKDSSSLVFFFRLFSSRLLHYSVNYSLFNWDEMDNTHQLFTGFYLTGVRIHRESPQRSFTEKKSIVDGEPTKNTSNRKHLSKSSLIHVQLLFTFFSFFASLHPPKLYIYVLWAALLLHHCFHSSLSLSHLLVFLSRLFSNIACCFRYDGFFFNYVLTSGSKSNMALFFDLFSGFFER